MHQVEVTTPAAADPVTAAELRAHLRLNDATEDALLTEFIQSAAERFEAEAGRPVLSTVYRQYFDYWTSPVVLMRGGVTAVAAVKYYQAAGGTADVLGYRAVLTTPPARVYVPSFPSAATDADGNPVYPAGYVEYTAGWAGAAAVPKAVRTAVKLLAGHFYENREAYRDSAFELRAMPKGWAAVVAQYKTGLSGPWGQ